MKKQIEAAAADDGSEQASNFTLEHLESLQSLIKLAEKEGKLTKKERRTVSGYSASVGFLNSQPLHIKLVLLGLYNELLHMRHRATTDSL